MRTKILLLFTFFLLQNTFAQIEFDLSGYAENYFLYQKENKTSLFNTASNITNFSRIRLRPTIYLWTGARVNIEYEINAIAQKENNLPINFSFPNQTQLNSFSYKIINNRNFILKHFIDRFSFKQSFKWGNVIIGRQRIQWGTGRVWNPVDLFNPINPTEFYKIEKNGADAFTLKYNLGNFSDIQIVFNPYNKFNKYNSAFRVRTNFSEFDFSIVGGYFNNQYIIGGDFAGNLFKAGIRGEILQRINNLTKENYTHFILGIDYQFSPYLYGLLEYQYYGKGESQKRNYNYFNLTTGNIFNLGKDYIAANISYQINPLLNCLFLNILNLNDSSGFINTNIEYSATEDFYLSVGIQLGYGSAGSEYNYLPVIIFTKCSYYF